MPLAYDLGQIVVFFDRRLEFALSITCRFLKLGLLAII